MPWPDESNNKGLKKFKTKKKTIPRPERTTWVGTNGAAIKRIEKKCFDVNKC
jgi:hypothetical protein